MSKKFILDKKIDTKKRILGRGLDSLFSSVSKENLLKKSGVIKISQLGIEQIQADPQQPRKIFDKELLIQLADSIKKNGLIQPIVVKKVGLKYEIIAGERRWRAAAQAGLHTIPVRVLEQTQTNPFLSLVENLQRQNLNSIELAKAYFALIQKHKCTQESLADQLGIPRASLANQLRILKLPQQVQQLILENKLSFALAKILLQETSPSLQIKWAQYFVKNKVSARSAQKLLSKEVSKKVDNNVQTLKDWQKQAINKIQEVHGVKSSIYFKKKGGELKLRYFSDKELNYLMDILVHQ